MQEGAGGGTMLVYPKRRPSAMQLHCFRSKLLQRCFTSISSSFSGIEIKRHSLRLCFSWALSFGMLLVLGNTPSEQKQKEEDGFPSSWSLNTFKLALRSAIQTPGHLQETSTFRKLQRRALPIAAG